MLKILRMDIEFYLPGCQSLKEKRQRIGRLADKLGRLPQLALCESANQDNHQHSRWGIVIAAATPALVDRHCALVETTCAELDAVVVRVTRERLA